MSPSAASPSADEALSSLMGAVTATLEYSRLDPAHAATVRDWQPVQTAIYDYLEGYELRLDDGCHTPTEFERFLLVDAVAGLMEDDEFIGAMLEAIATPAAAPDAANPTRIEPERQPNPDPALGASGKPVPCALSKIPSAAGEIHRR